MFAPDLVTSHYRSPLGPMLMAGGPHGLAGLWFEGQDHWPHGAAHWPGDDNQAAFALTRGWLDAYFAGADAHELPPLPPIDLSSGTRFQQQVWQALREVPRGSTLSYQDLARRIGAPSASRAVGAAVGRNPVSVLVPCHRVLGAKGALTGYAAGLERKKALLRLEGLPH